jgi:hypothetical protein
MEGSSSTPEQSRIVVVDASGKARHSSGSAVRQIRGELD